MNSNGNRNVTLDDLAEMVAGGFDHANQRFDKLEGEMVNLKGEMQGLRSSVNNYLELSGKGI